MKKIYYLLVAIPMLLLQQCSTQEEPAIAETVQFTFSPSVSNSGGRTSSSFSDVHALRLSVQKHNGETLFAMKEIELIKFGDALISEPIELIASTYKVTDFLLVDKNGAVLYATPKQGSPLAGSVSQALPFYFSVDKNSTANIDVGVIDVTYHKPEDFGYASFTIREVLAFQLSAQIFQDGKFKLTDAKAYITQGETPVATIDLGAKINNVSFKGDASKTYTIKVVKDTYSTFTKEFVYADLLTELEGKPLKANLDALMTFTTSVFQFRMTLSGASAVKVDWGDGTTSTEVDEEGEFEHDYGNEGPHHVVVTGDLEHITVLRCYYGDGSFDELNINHLINLESFTAALGWGPVVVDLTHTKKLQAVDVTGMHILEELRLPADHRIRNMAISGVNRLNTADVDAIIDDVYETAVLHNIRDGNFELGDVWYQPTGPLGPPSPDRLLKVRDLKENYGWRVVPE